MTNRYPLLEMNPTQAYEQYMVPGIMRPGVELMLQYALPQRGERVLDIACGTGIVARTVAPLLGAAGTVTGLDINPTMLSVARGLPQAEGVAIDWREGNVLSMPFADQAFDLVLCHQGLQFFPDKVAALREVRRVLVRGGRLVVNVQQSLNSNPIYKTLNEVLVAKMGIPALAAPFSFGDVEPMHDALTKAGFPQVEVIPVMQSIRFASIDVFLQASLIGSAAVIPILAQLDMTAKTELMDHIKQDMTHTLQAFVSEDGSLVMPLAALVGLAVA